MSLLTLDIEKAAAGGRMLARHGGQVVLVSGAIPGERVTARLERIERGVAFAEVEQIIQVSVDRRAVVGEARCGGNVFSHIEYQRQLRLKGEIIQDAFRRIGRIPLSEPPLVSPSPEHGYRMRARLHVGDGQMGFYLEGTHQLCDAATTGQLLPGTCEWIAVALATLGSTALRGLSGMEIAENIPADQRACHLELLAGAEPAHYAAIADGLTGLSAQCADRAGLVRIAGTPRVSDSIPAGDRPQQLLFLSRDVRAFFQGNRFLIASLVRRVIEVVPRGPVIDLYAGVGLFGLSLAAAGWAQVTAVEGDPVAGIDLRRNAEPFGGRVAAVHRSVERYVESVKPQAVAEATVIVDPPRTGISKRAIAHIARLQPPRIVYISCDAATLARDARVLHEAGYGLAHLSGIDLFPNTAHVETLAVFACA